MNTRKQIAKKIASLNFNPKSTGKYQAREDFPGIYERLAISTFSSEHIRSATTENQSDLEKSGHKKNDFTKGQTPLPKPKTSKFLCLL